MFEIRQVDVLTAVVTAVALGAAYVWLGRRQRQRRQVTFGTINILGDAANPIEFRPGSVNNDYQEAHEQLLRTINTISFAEVAKNAPKHSDAILNMTQALGLKANDYIMNHLSEIDLSLDNQVGSADGRVNPIILGLETIWSGVSTPMRQYQLAIIDPESILERALQFYSEHSEINDTQWIALLTWDLLCISAVTKSPEAFGILAKASYAVDTNTGIPHDRDVLLGRILDYLQVVVEQTPGAPAVVGVQEAPPNLKSKLPPGYNMQYANIESGPKTAFIFYNCTLCKDLSKEFHGEFNAFLKGKVSDRIRLTTVDRLFIAQFSLPCEDEVAVLNFHVRSFRDNVHLLGQFMAHALLRVREVTGLRTVAIGDTNVDTEWGKEYTPSQQIAMLKGARSGMLPENLLQQPQTYMQGLHDTLSESASGEFTSVPPMGTITTLKVRTCFQAQSEKAGRIVAGQKDVLVLPPDVSVNGFVVGKRDSFDSNLGLFLPSDEWPGDHFAVFAHCDLN